MQIEISLIQLDKSLILVKDMSKSIIFKVELSSIQLYI